MSKGRQFTTATFATLAVLACLSAKAEAAQCGSTPAGFEAWKREFAEQARAKGISASTAAAVMQATYAAATIAADRGQRSFSLSLDQFLAKRGASAIVARGRALKQSQAALFASIQQHYGVPAGPLIAIWGMETAFGSQRGNQNTLSAVATLARSGSVVRKERAASPAAWLSPSKTAAGSPERPAGYCCSPQ